MKINGDQSFLNSNPQSIPLPLFLLVIMIMIIHVTATKPTLKPTLCSSSCGEIGNISSPFRLTTDPINCGDLRYDLTCENNLTLVLSFFADERSVQYDTPKRFVVRSINYDNYTIRIVDPEIHDGTNCSSVPRNTLSRSDRFFLDWNPYIYETDIRLGFLRQASMSGNPIATFKTTRVISQTVILFGCEKAVNSSKYILSPCKFSGNCSSKESQYSYYYLMGDEFRSSDFDASCCVQQMSLVSLGEINNHRLMPISSGEIYDAMVRGFELSWVQSFDKIGDRLCYVDDKNRKKVSCLTGCQFIDYRVDFGCHPFHTFLAYLQLYIAIKGGYKYIVAAIAPRTVAGIIFLVGLFIYKWRRRNVSMFEEIERFLQTHHNLAPIKYSYSDIKKMTKGFKEKLGEGGFGSVYKGKLRSGYLVAIKVLGKSKGPTNWQDFINEVATIGRIHHVNVVQLVGFCVEGSKRALVFDFMPNGSLDKYILSGDSSSSNSSNHPSLSCEKRFEISLDVARGIEYLHRGCDMQILHFDIKPHNILLDGDFRARVSDFGLARLCPLDNSIVALTAARGTMGYIAPELFYKNIGGVSYKADVYSFGMLLMEMASRKRNTYVNGTDDSDAVYFPLWVHEQFSKGKRVHVDGNDDMSEDELKTMEKMIVVALWCIQLKPSDRPSMSKVIEMLECEFESLEIPPKPCLYPNETNGTTVEDSSCTTTTWSTAMSDNSTEISFIQNEYYG